MVEIVTVHPNNPQVRLLQHVVDVIETGGVIAVPTDSGYSLCCSLGNKTGADKIRRLRDLDKHHHFTLFCEDIRQAAFYAHISTPHFRLLNRLWPGPYTIILQATKIVPRVLIHPKRRVIGIRISADQVMQTLLGILGEPLMSVSLFAAADEHMLVTLEDVVDNVQNGIAMVVDAGPRSRLPTTVLDLTAAEPIVVRQGVGINQL